MRRQTQGESLPTLSGGTSGQKRMTKYFKRFLPALLATTAIALTVVPTVSSNPSLDQDTNRARILSYLIRDQLPQHHFTHKPIDDALSKAAFGLFLKQVDGQKRFLLDSDVKRLSAFTTRIDDEMQQGRMELSVITQQIMAQRLAKVAAMVEEIMAGKMDFNAHEELETDPEKITYCTTENQLRVRWAKELKYQVISRYLNLLEDQKAEKDKEAKSQDQLKKEATEKVLKSYREFFQRLQKETKKDYFDRYFSSVTRAYDPHTDYMPPTEKEDFDIGMRGSLEGIGATLREEDGYIKVVSIIPGSASARQGQLHAEDIILKVAEAAAEPVDISGTLLRKAVSLIRGPKGTEVRLTVRKPDGVIQVIPIVRDVVKIEETFVKGALLQDDKTGARYGYILIPSFYRDFRGSAGGGNGRNVTDDVKAELEKLKKEKISGLLLDLRNDGGGALTDAVSIAGLFLDSGPVVQVKNSYGRIETLADRDAGVDYDGPVVVMVNQFSASASEILAGVLQDYGRAVIIGGAHTHGKGTVQTLVDLDQRVPFTNAQKYLPLGALKITVQKFYRVSGGSTQYRGVVPDIVLPDRLQHLKTGEKFAEYSLPWDTVEGTSYARWSKVPDLETLKTMSLERVAADKRFTEIAEAAAKAKSRTEQTLQSINLEDIRKEREVARNEAKESPHSPFGTHGSSDTAGAKKKEQVLSPEEKARELVDRLGEDPYTLEALSVLGDMVNPSGRKVAIVSSRGGASSDKAQ